MAISKEYCWQQLAVILVIWCPYLFGVWIQGGHVFIYRTFEVTKQCPAGKNSIDQHQNTAYVVFWWWFWCWSMLFFPAVHLSWMWKSLWVDWTGLFRSHIVVWFGDWLLHNDREQLGTFPSWPIRDCWLHCWWKALNRWEIGHSCDPHVSRCCQPQNFCYVFCLHNFIHYGVLQVGCALCKGFYLLTIAWHLHASPLVHYHSRVFCT